MKTPPGGEKSIGGASRASPVRLANEGNADADISSRVISERSVGSVKRFIVPEQTRIGPGNMPQADCAWQIDYHSDGLVRGCSAPDGCTGACCIFAIV